MVVSYSENFQTIPSVHKLFACTVEIELLLKANVGNAVSNLVMTASVLKEGHTAKSCSSSSSRPSYSALCTYRPAILD